MKIRIYFFLLTGWLLISTCEKTNDFGLKDYGLSECKSNLKSYNPESIHIKMLRNNQLLVEHLDTYFCCLDPGITLESELVEGNHIKINENDKVCIVDCICRYDLSFKVTGINKGETIISIFRDGLKKFSCTLILTNQTDTTVVLNPV